MTQELVMVVLLIGLVGLVWIVTMSILVQDRTQSNSEPTETAQPNRDNAGDPETPLELLIKDRTNVA